MRQSQSAQLLKTAHEKRLQMKKMEEEPELTKEEKEKIMDEILDMHHRVYDRLAEI